ncbi:hypothetical protein TBLA_0D02110 [Henningerozyma blattae CBS 6284]|uniref:Uncharacterized protein n=1 Tax=Henningerozyma blattae (strain ATCC 34711 / CBS 6284 / DSM 70876 / NBRC 10599 / NRRL Y-10934 / UCD 77-7) TaxID=1071380 RepID=I2H2W5_HENB6|nr:hypothetical protein TBLA_0D02110 [Tetrapisispora blattae CBS 6284]CCH60717.1 hypothetical protein TBLA_0D02110 [Tetrapisispora blattae CBS 6284]
MELYCEKRLGNTESNENQKRDDNECSTRIKEISEEEFVYLDCPISDLDKHKNKNANFDTNDTAKRAKSKLIYTNNYGSKTQFLKMKNDIDFQMLKKKPSLNEEHLLSSKKTHKNKILSNPNENCKNPDHSFIGTNFSNNFLSSLKNNGMQMFNLKKYKNFEISRMKNRSPKFFFILDAFYDMNKINNRLFATILIFKVIYMEKETSEAYIKTVKIIEIMNIFFLVCIQTYIIFIKKLFGERTTYFTRYNEGTLASTLRLILRFLEPLIFTSYNLLKMNMIRTIQLSSASYFDQILTSVSFYIVLGVTLSLNKDSVNELLFKDLVI